MTGSMVNVRGLVAFGIRFVTNAVASEDVDTAEAMSSYVVSRIDRDMLHIE